MYLVKEALSMLFSSVMGSLETEEPQKPKELRKHQKLIEVRFTHERESQKTPPDGIVVIGHGIWPPNSHSRYGGSLVTSDLFLLDSEYLNRENVLLRAVQRVLEGIGQETLDRGGNCVLNLMFNLDPFSTRNGETGLLLDAAGTSATLESMDEYLDRKYGVPKQTGLVRKNYYSF